MKDNGFEVVHGEPAARKHGDVADWSPRARFASDRLRYHFL